MIAFNGGGGGVSAAIAWVLIHFLWQGTLIAFFAMLILKVIRFSAARYNVAVLALVLMAACPIFTLARVWPQRASGYNPATESRDVGSSASFDTVPSSRPAKSIDDSRRLNETAVVDAVEPADGLLTLRRKVEDHSSFLILAYAAGFTVMLARLWLAFVAANRLRQNALPLRDPATLTRINELSRRLDLKLTPILAESVRVSVPVVVGVIRPMILVPTAFMTSMSVDQIESILAHELAHIRRFDAWVNVTQRVIETILFFHPAIWWVSRRISHERETACDDIVVARSFDRLTYADALVAMAERCLGATSPETATVLSSAGNTSTEMKSRIPRLVAHPSNARIDGPVTRCGKSALVSALIFLLFFTLMLTFPSRGPAGPPRVEPSQEKTQKANAEEAAPQPADENGIYRAPITITGRASTWDSRPVVGARVFLGSAGGGHSLVAETRTDQDGKYRFDDAELPIEISDHRLTPDHGDFEIFGYADDLGLAWRNTKSYFPTGVPENLEVDENPDGKSDYSRGDNIIQDLKFAKPTRLSGQVVNSKGEPIPNTRIRLFSVWPVPASGYDSFDQMADMGSRDFNLLAHTRVISRELTEQTTDLEGNFEFREVPEQTAFRVAINPPGYARRMFYAATSSRESIRFEKPEVEFDQMKLVFDSVHSVPFSVVYGDTRKPAPHVHVELNSSNVGSSGRTDQQGQVSLKVPAGEYRLTYLVEYGTPYVSRAYDSRISQDTILETQVTGNDQKSVQIVLEPAATIDAEVVDAATGKPLAEVDFWVNKDGNRVGYMWQSYKLPNVSMVDRPRTNSDGKVRLLIEPGEQTLGPGYRYTPAGYREDYGGVQENYEAGKIYSQRYVLEKY